MNSVPINSNDIENGYIYKNLINRISNIEKAQENITNLLQNIQINGNIFDLENLLKSINNLVDKKTFENHVNDDRIHVNGIMETYMGSENFVSRKTAKIVQPRIQNYEFVHDLKSYDIGVFIYDSSNNKIDREYVQNNSKSITIKFLSSDIGKNFRIIVFA